MNIFLDCGTNLGQGLEKIYKEIGMDDNWYIYCFEINNQCIDIIKNQLINKYKNINIINKGVWINDSLLPVIKEYCPTQKDWVGGASNILNNNFFKPHYIPNNFIKKDGEIEGIDFSKFILNNFKKNDYIVCKMDMEGAEYSVLNKMIEDNSIDYIDILFIEWHVISNNAINRSFLINELNKRKIKIIRHH